MKKKSAEPSKSGKEQQHFFKTLNGGSHARHGWNGRHGRFDGPGAEELKQTEFTGEAANGAVKVVITGGHECRSIKIDPKVVDPEDIEMLEDLVMLAFNNAQQTCRTESEAAMNKAVPLPAGMKLPF